MIKSYHKQTGLSLVELMIAVTLSLVLTLGVIQIFSSSKQTSRVQNELARLQENARFALDILSHDIRMAGQLGCNSNAIISNNTGELANFRSGIFGYEYSSGLTVALTTDAGDPNPDDADIIANTDAIVVMAASANGIPASSSTTVVTASDPNNNINFAAGNPFEVDAGDPLIISDCTNADLFIASAVANNTVTSNLSKAYSSDAKLARLNYNAFYLRNDNGQRNLYRSYVNAETGNASVTTEALLEGVEDLQILYGEDINGNGNAIRYVNASAAGLNWNNVVSVRIHLLLATQADNLASANQRYWYVNCDAGAPNTLALCQPAADRKLYRSFTSTIQLRNQGIGT